jgi:hypothetical protein
MDEEGWRAFLAGPQRAVPERSFPQAMPGFRVLRPQSIPFRFPVGAAIVLWLQSARNAGLLASAYAVELPGNAR